jgi:hypothetical protein
VFCSIWNSLIDLNSLSTSGSNCCLSIRWFTYRFNTDLDTRRCHILLIINLVDIEG